MQVIDMNSILRRFVPDLVRTPIGRSTPNATTGHPRNKVMRIMIASRFSSGLSNRQSSKFTAPDHESFR